MPDIAVAAPATPAVPTPAPASTPATPATPATPSTPVVSTTAVQTPAETPSVLQPAIQTGSPEPKSEDFGTIAEFTKAHFKWQDEQAGAPTEDKPADIPADVPAEKTPEEIAAETDTQVTDPDTPVDIPDEPESLTPESLSKLESETPGLKELFDANPAVKGQFFKMARENARLAPLGDIFPNLDSAKFANETASRTVAIKTGFLQAANDPSKIGDAFNQFVDEFREYDADGKPMEDAGGNPVLGKDFELLTNHVVTSYFDGEIGDVEARLTANKYGSETAKENDEALLQAYKFIKAAKDADPLDFERPDTSQMTDEQRQYFERREAQLKKKEEDAGLRDKTQNTKEQQAARQTHNAKVAQTVNGEFGKRLDEIVAQKKADNVNLPWFALQALDTDGVSIFAKSVHQQFLEKTVGHIDRTTGKRVGGIPKVLNDFAILEAQPPSEAVANQRIALFRQLREEYMPAIAEAEIKKLQKAERESRAQRTAVRDKAMQGVQPEPKPGAAPKLAALTQDQAFEKARAEVAKVPGYESMSDAERERLVIQKAMRATW